ncbi:N-acetylmuramoyl-L-alanine amidase family protein [Clostridium sp.]|uniref:N-acetylmuramoyl-L-alanine amidase family protein n=1 Tax=Clostridium sp. TaxID=1506 RepID=UPI00260F11EC|nr:N-acetylmuramoyl-L-alanine amidase family protein [Clostridium sp.]
MKTLKLRKFIVLAAMTLVATATILPMKASAAWRQSNSGDWSYIDGNSAISGWKLIDGKWYFFDSNSVMKTGWINDGGKWYYLDPSGSMKTGWINDSGKWYYTSSSGDMQTGWLLDNGAWYYLNTSGSMQTGLLDLNGKTYYLSESGAMKTGNITINGVNYNFAASGEKINSPVAPQTAVNSTATGTTAATTGTTAATTASSGGSGGSGGGSGSSGGSTTKASYEKLYGTWTVGECISKGSINEDYDAYIDMAIGQQFTISKDNISATVPSLGLVTVPYSNVSVATITPSAFYDKNKVKISGNTVQCFTATINISSLNKSYPVTVFISDNGDAYASIKDALFKLEK